MLACFCECHVCVIEQKETHTNKQVVPMPHSTRLCWDLCSCLRSTDLQCPFPESTPCWSRRVLLTRPLSLLVPSLTTSDCWTFQRPLSLLWDSLPVLRLESSRLVVRLSPWTSWHWELQRVRTPSLWEVQETPERLSDTLVSVHTRVRLQRLSPRVESSREPEVEETPEVSRSKGLRHLIHFCKVFRYCRTLMKFPGTVNVFLWYKNWMIVVSCGLRLYWIYCQSDLCW